jgi:protein phosphatase
MSSNRLVEASLRTHQGRIRDHNEDFITSREPANSEDEAQNGWLYIVADGVGGADAGEIASQYAAERTVEHYVNDNRTSNWGQRLRDAMRAANTDLRQFVADRNDHSRMATTMVAVAFAEGTAYLANVGDSRGYLWRNGGFSQITKDQSLVAKLLEEGAITEAEAAVHPRKNVILYSLGSEKEPQIDLYEQKMEPGDILMLCSDGLTRHVADEELATIVSRQEPAVATRTLIHLANSRGGEDNISVAVLNYGPRRGSKRARKEPVTEVKSDGRPVLGRAVLWTYTILLSLVQTVLIVLAWLLLRV